MGVVPIMQWHPQTVVLEGVDPHCVAYKKIFDEISDRFNKEMFENPVMEMTSFDHHPENLPDLE